jgi:hypothetical protein
MTDLFTLAEAKSWLGIDPAETAYDDRLADVIAATTTIVERRTGKLGARTEARTFPLWCPEFPGWRGFDIPVGGASKIALPHYPITAVTGVTIEGQEIPAADYRADLRSGVIRFFWGINGDVTVTYQVGSDTIADNVSLAAKIIAQDLWQEQMIQFATGSEPAQVDPKLYLMPRRALLLLPKLPTFA